VLLRDRDAPATLAAVATSWDRRSAKQIASLQDELVRAQVRLVGSASSYWKQRFDDIGRSPTAFQNVTSLAALPAVGERDVSPQGDAAAMAGLVLQGGERQFALHTSGPQLRRALRLRVTRSSDYQRIVDAETRPTSYVWTGLGFRYPLASTRGDLDAVARAGARLWAVLGLSRDDALLSAVPVAATTEHVALQYAALAAGAPALFPGDDLGAVTAAARLAPPTALAVRVSDAESVVDALAAAGALDRLTTVIVVGAPTRAERSDVVAALSAVGASQATVLAVHAPSGARVLWAECRASGGNHGLHTYPDLDVVQVVDPESGEHVGSGGGELVLTQLGMRGSAMLRWRTGDLVDEVTTGPCPSCGRNVPRVVGVRRGALVVRAGGGRALDLRSLAGVLAGRPELDDWRVVVGGRSRDGRDQVVVHIATQGDAGEVAVAAAADIRSVAGRLPTQLVATTADELGAISGDALGPRVLIRR
jgi:phenylacetate-coenzyme A ligase PaaK-like adenylate-forming protein